MRMIKIAALALALSASAAAQANPAASLSVTRAAAPKAKTSKLAGSGYISYVLVAAGVIATIVAVSTGRDNADSN